MYFFLFRTWCDYWYSLICRVILCLNWIFWCRSISWSFVNLCKIFIIDFLDKNILFIAWFPLSLLEKEIDMGLLLSRWWFNGWSSWITEVKVLCSVIITHLHLKIKLLLVAHLIQEIEMGFLFLCWWFYWWDAWVWEVQILACIIVLEFHLEV